MSLSYFKRALESSGQLHQILRINAVGGAVDLTIDTLGDFRDMDRIKPVTLTTGQFIFINLRKIAKYTVESSSLGDAVIDMYSTQGFSEPYQVLDAGEHSPTVTFAPDVTSTGHASR